MQASHMVSAVSDDPDLIGSAALVPVMRLAERAGFRDFLQCHLTVPYPNTDMKAAGLVSGVLAGATPSTTSTSSAIGDGQGLHRGEEPWTLGTFLRSFRSGRVGS